MVENIYIMKELGRSKCIMKILRVMFCIVDPTTGPRGRGPSVVRMWAAALQEVRAMALSRHPDVRNAGAISIHTFDQPGDLPIKEMEEIACDIEKPWPVRERCWWPRQGSWRCRQALEYRQAALEVSAADAGLSELDTSP